MHLYVVYDDYKLDLSSNGRKALVHNLCNFILFPVFVFGIVIISLSFSLVQIGLASLGHARLKDRNLS